MAAGVARWLLIAAGAAFALYVIGGLSMAISNGFSRDFFELGFLFWTLLAAYAIIPLLIAAGVAWLISRRRQ